MDPLMLGKEPVSADQPTGADVRYEPEFDQVQAEIDKLSSPSATEATDWRNVSEISAQILAEKSKDILVAGYFAVSQIHLNKTDGLETGMLVFKDLLETYWEDLFPKKKRMRGRIGAIEWWIEKSQAALGQIKPSPISQEKKQSIKEHLEKIDNLLASYLDEPPFMRELKQALNDLPTKAEPKPASAEPAKTPESEPKAEVPLETATPVSPKPQPAAQPAAPQEMASESDAQKVIANAFTNIKKAAAFIRTNNPAGPQSYRLLRIALWSRIDTLPMASEGSKTIIPGPDPQTIASLKELKAKGDYANLLAYAENKLQEFVFWLDLNRYTAESMAGLGGPYERAKETVGQETSNLLQRFPGLDNLQFADGTPFADNDTKSWLKEAGAGGVSTVMAPVAVVTSDARGNSQNEMAVQIANAQELAKKKKLPEAVELLQNNLRSCFSKREKMLWRLALAQILMGTKKAGTAVPLLEQTLHEIEEFKLEKWDPELALNGLQVVFAGFKGSSDADIKNKANEILGRIATLDAVEALKMS